MSQALAKQAQTVAELFHKNAQKVQTRLAGVIDPNQFMAVALTSIHKNPKLLQCDANTLLSTLYQSASLGLYLDDVRGEAYPVPFWNSKRNTFECQLIVGYKGFIKLFHMSGGVSDVSARLVYDKEAFDVEYGETTKIKHSPKPPKTRGKEIVAAYAIATMKDGTKHVELLWGEEIEAIRARSPGGKPRDDKKKGPPSVWDTDKEAMYLKSPVRKLAKFIPIGKLGQAAALDELADAGRATYEPVLEGEIVIPDTPTLPDKTEYDPEKSTTEAPQDERIGKVDAKEAPPEGSMDWYQDKVKKAGRLAGKTDGAIRSAMGRATKELTNEEDCIAALKVLLTSYNELPPEAPEAQGEFGV